MPETIEPTIAISLTVKSAADALDFYSKAFGTTELFRMPMPDGTVAHAEFMIGNSLIYISGEDPIWHAKALEENTYASCLFAINTENCNDACEQALAAGATLLNPPKDEFWGFRCSMIVDPFGYRWNLRQKIEEVSSEEMAKRVQALMAAGKL